MTQLAQIQPDEPELSPPPSTISFEPGLPRPRWRRRSTAVIAAIVLLLGEAATAAYLIWINPPVHPGVKEATFKTFPGHQTFPGHSGQKVFIEATSSTLLQHRECGVLELRDPAGKEIASGCVGDGKGYIDSTQLSADGDYTVTLDPSNDAVGEATVRVIDIVDQDVGISADGSPVTATIGQPGAVSRLRFTGTAGQKVSVVVTSSTLPNQCGVLALRDRANKELARGCIIDGTGLIDTTTLRVAGEYTILVDPNDAATGDAQVQLFNVVDQDAGISADGSPVTATIGQPGAVSGSRSDTWKPEVRLSTAKLT